MPHHRRNRQRPRSAPLRRVAGLGATAIYPYLAYETLGRLVDTMRLPKIIVP